MEQLERETINYKSETEWLTERSKDITSTEVAALFGLSHFWTLRTLWEAKKSGAVTSIEPTKRMRAGKKMEPQIAELLAEDNGWEIEPMKFYMRLQNERIGSSFDYRIKSFGNIPLEIKLVNPMNKKEWLDSNGELTAPFMYELQLQNELLVSGNKEGFIGVSFGVDDWFAIHRDANEQIQQLILDKAAEFWKSIEDNNPPAWDYESTIDQDAIKSMYKTVEEDKTIEIGPDVEAWCEAYLELKKNISFEDKQAKALQMQILEQIGDAKIAIGKGYKVSAGLVRKKEYVVKASESRQVRVSSLAEK